MLIANQVFPSPAYTMTIAICILGGDGAMKISLNVNGKSVTITAADPQMPLLYALRDDLGLHGPRFGCGLGQCGACTVHIDGNAVRSCITPLSSVGDRDVVT